MARNSHNICWIKQTKSLKLYLFTCKRQAWDLSGQSTSNSPTFSIIKSFWSWGEVVVNLFTRTLFPIRNWHSEAMRLGNCRTIAHSIAVPTGVWRTVYSVSPIYRGRVYRGIGYIAVACWTPFFGAQEGDIFREIAVTPWIQFVGDNFSPNLLTVIAFVLCPRETIFRETNSSLPVNAGWNTCCAMVSHARRSIDTSIVLQSRVQLIQCQCKSRLQIAYLGINNAFFNQIHAVYIRHFVQASGQFRSKSRARDW